MRPGSEKGFTIVEVVVAIALIGIAISLSVVSLRTIFNSSVSSYATQLSNEIRLVQSREMASSKNDYELIISYDGTEDIYRIRTYIEAGGNPRKVLKTIDMPKAIRVAKNGVPLSDSAYNDVSTRSFRFSPSSGGLITDGDGTYTITSTASTVTRDVVVVGFNGRVYIDE